MEHFYKGQDVLLKALRRCLDRGVGVRLTLLGDGRRRAELERLARRLELGERACFLGPAAAGAEVRGRLDEAGLFVLPSRQEGLPRALIEAMARGLPAIASRIGGVPELLSDEFLVQPGCARELAERISELALSPLLRDQSARENLLTARRYSDAESTPARDAFYRFVRRATA
jgi:glycosyltransferase involved in cell wall biosynthesis